MVDTSNPDRRGTRSNGAAPLDDGETPISLTTARRYAHEDPTLASMIEKGIPLTRNAWLTLSYGHELPEGDAWNSEHEAGLPEPFQRPINRPRNATK